jgi:hypothetical protein
VLEVLFMNYEQLMRTARKTNAERDEIDHQADFTRPEAGPPILLLPTATSAIESGIRTNDWNSVAEAQAMLEALVKRV